MTSGICSCEIKNVVISLAALSAIETSLRVACFASNVSDSFSRPDPKSLDFYLPY